MFGNHRSNWIENLLESNGIHDLKPLTGGRLDVAGDVLAARQMRSHGEATVEPWPVPTATSGSATPSGQGGISVMAPSLPTDSLFGSQYYLRNTASGERDLALFRGDTSVWDEFTGEGIRIGVIDDGVDSTHQDLNDNYNASRHVVVEGVAIDGMPPGSNGAHGTGVAGIIAAERNGFGVVGIAYDAEITGMSAIPDRFGTAPRTSSANAIGNYAQFDVINNSWGFTTPMFDMPYNNQLSEDHAALFDVVQYGRGGLGTIFVKAAGNGRANDDNANFSFLNSFSGTITVAAVLRDGNVSEYSTPGAAVLVSAFGGPIPGDVVTTDRPGSGGEDPGDFNTQFNGTSAATPMISGIAALMLDANPNLGYRDVQAILALTARHTGTPIGTTPTGPAYYEWEWNHATNWNGGGMHFSEDFGFGLADTLAAVRLAETWASQNTLNNEITITPVSSTLTAPRAIGDTGIISITFAVTENITAEHVRLELGLAHNGLADLKIRLISPDGTTSELLRNEGGTNPQTGFLRPVTNYGAYDLSFNSNMFRGEDTAGTWTLQIEATDFANGGQGTLSRARLSLSGSSELNDVYVFTEEYSNYVTAARQLISDTDGGVDTLNASAVFTASTINLVANAVSIIDGVAVRTNGLVENATGGDGNDTLTGNNLINQLRGMRGNDVYFVDQAGDVVLETAGQGLDRILASTSYSLAVAASVEMLTTTLTSGTTAINLVGNELANTIVGNAGANILNGRGGIDTLRGFGGNDQYYVDHTGDVIMEVAGEGTDRVIAATSYTLGSGVSAEFLTTTDANGVAAINLFGNQLAQSIIGNRGVNILQGGGGADALTPGSDTAADTIRFVAVSDSTSTTRDTITGLDLNGEDKLDFTLIPTGAIGFVGGNLSDASFNADIAAAVNGALGPKGAVLFDPTGGTLNTAGHAYLVVDANNDGAYTAGADYLVQLINTTGTLDLTDFV